MKRLLLATVLLLGLASAVTGAVSPSAENLINPSHVTYITSQNGDL